MTFQIFEPDTEEYHTFQNNVKKRMREDFNLTTEDGWIYSVGFPYCCLCFRSNSLLSVSKDIQTWGDPNYNSLNNN